MVKQNNIIMRNWEIKANKLPLYREIMDDMMAFSLFFFVSMLLERKKKKKSMFFCGPSPRRQTELVIWQKKDRKRKKQKKKQQDSNKLIKWNILIFCLGLSLLHIWRLISVMLVQVLQHIEQRESRVVLWTRHTMNGFNGIFWSWLLAVSMQSLYQCDKWTDVYIFFALVFVREEYVYVTCFEWEASLSLQTNGTIFLHQLHCISDKCELGGTIFVWLFDFVVRFDHCFYIRRLCQLFFFGPNAYT